jgi:hypothetical protein
MSAAKALGRNFIGCDKAYASASASATFPSPAAEMPWQTGTLFSTDAPLAG